MSPPKPADICAVVITYHPDSGFEARVRRLLPQVGGLVIVDNHSNPAELRVLRELAESTGSKLLENAANHGVGTALNQGILRAKAHGFSWVITFDQDSLAAPNLVENMCGICAALGGEELARLGVLGTNHLDRNSHKTQVPLIDGRAFIEQKTVITSGSMLSVTAYDDIGAFREDLFYGSIDHEYCLRARSRGYRVLIALAPLLDHAIGEKTRKFTVNYAPQRWYYIVRNAILVARQYFPEDPRWSIWRLYRLLGRSAGVLVLEKDKLEKAKYMLGGARDAMLGRTGKLED